MTLLDERELSDAERLAIADEPRPGVWIEEHEVYVKLATHPLSAQTGEPIEVKPEIDRSGDGRTLTQHETDVLIVRELWRRTQNGATFPVSAELHSAVLPWLGPMLLDTDGGKYRSEAYQQRGGLHSDEVVRLLAFRAWGERDRANDLVKLRATIDLLASLHGVTRLAVIADMRRLGGTIDPLVERLFELIEQRERAAERARVEIDRRLALLSPRRAKPPR